MVNVMKLQALSDQTQWSKTFGEHERFRIELHACAPPSTRSTNPRPQYHASALTERTPPRTRACQRHLGVQIHSRKTATAAPEARSVFDSTAQIEFLCKMHAAHQVSRDALHGLVQSQAASDITRNNKGWREGEKRREQAIGCVMRCESHLFMAVKHASASVSTSTDSVK
jgi:hypothetical protein